MEGLIYYKYCCSVTLYEICSTFWCNRLLICEKKLETFSNSV